MPPSPAARAVSTSVMLSPTIIVLAGYAPKAAMTRAAPAGSGLFVDLVSPPRMQPNAPATPRACKRSWAIASGSLVQTPRATPASRKAAERARSTRIEAGEHGRPRGVKLEQSGRGPLLRLAVERSTMGGEAPVEERAKSAADHSAHGCGGRSSSASVWFNAAARSRAVSTNVPSRSKITARRGESEPIRWRRRGPARRYAGSRRCYRRRRPP
jgi:hypothetical protein